MMSIKQTIWFIICWAVIMPVNAVFFSENIPPYLQMLELMPLFIMVFFFWYITFRMKRLGFLMQWNLIWFSFGLLFLESSFAHLCGIKWSWCNDIFLMTWALPLFGVPFFFIFQLIKKLFFNQEDAHIPRNYVPVKKSIRLIFSICSVVCVFYYIGWWIMLINNAIREEIEGYYWIN